MTFGSLFAGIGGFDLGFERAGMTCKWQVEIDEYCRRVLAKHWPDVRRWDDVRTFPPEPVSDWTVDVICGGFPCQDISVAGSGRGLAGERSGLWFQFEDTVRVLRPRFVVVENVSALLIRGFDRVLAGLAELGFDAEWGVIPVCAFGAPHSRERLFLIAYDRQIRRFESGEYTYGCNEISTGSPNWKAAPNRFEWRYVQRWIVETVENGGGIIPPAERGGMADGVSGRLDRIGATGNAVVPQVAEWIGRRIMETHRTEDAA